MPVRHSLDRGGGGGIADRMLRVANDGTGAPEVFGSLQGEGPRAGRPSVFLRLAACNLWCRWCDTPYTWRWSAQHPHEDGTTYDKAIEVLSVAPAALVTRILQLDCAHLVVTGGEPLLQQRALVPVLQALRSRGLQTVDIETNGTIAPSPELREQVDLFVVSPKTSSSGVPENVRLPASLAGFARLDSAAFKFVVANPQDLDEVRALVQRLGLPHDRVWLMPEGRTSQVLRNGAAWLAPVCQQEGFWLSDRLHVHLYGDTRGT